MSRDCVRGSKKSHGIHDKHDKMRTRGHGGVSTGPGQPNAPTAPPATLPLGIASWLVPSGSPLVRRVSASARVRATRCPARHSAATSCDTGRAGLRSAESVAECAPPPGQPPRRCRRRPRPNRPAAPPPASSLGHFGQLGGQAQYIALSCSQTPTRPATADRSLRSASPSPDNAPGLRHISNSCPQQRLEHFAASWSPDEPSTAPDACDL